MKRLLLTLSFALLLGSQPLAIRAADDTSSRLTIRLSPVLIEDEASPGESIMEVVTIENLSDSLLPVHARSTAITSADDSGSIKAVPESKVGEVQDWLTFDNDLILDPKKARQIPVRINIPKNATPGGHYAAIFFCPFQPGSNQAAGVSIQSQVGVLFFLTVKGDITRSGHLDQVQAPPVALKSTLPVSVKFTNTGTVHLEPVTTLTVRNFFGQEIDGINGNDQGSLTTLPKSTRIQHYEVPTDLEPGLYRLEVTTKSGNIVSQSSRWFLLLPYQLLLFLAPIVLLLLAGLGWWRGWFKRIRFFR